MTLVELDDFGGCCFSMWMAGALLTAIATLALANDAKHEAITQIVVVPKSLLRSRKRA